MILHPVVSQVCFVLLTLLLLCYLRGGIFSMASLKIAGHAGLIGDGFVELIRARLNHNAMYPSRLDGRVLLVHS